MAWTALLDIGSTYTKGIAVDLGSGRPIASVQVPSSVAEDVNLGVNLSVDQLTSRAGGPPSESYASSSARGGLGVVAVGLVPRFTLEAAQQAALGAGAKVLHGFGYKLTPDDLDAIGSADPDIILLCGGTDGGDELNITENASRLIDSLKPGPTVVIAGNRAASPKVAEMFDAMGWELQVLPNVLPDLDHLELDHVRRTLRTIFLEKITRANGIEAASQRLDGVVMPTPAAVLAAGELLSGHNNVPALLGELLIVDIGGATTDIVSVCEPAIYTGEEVYHVGLPEPTIKRTVEGDLGLRYNARTIVDRFGMPSATRGSGLTESQIDALVSGYEAEPARLPGGADEMALDAYLARTAIRQAAIRHAGLLEEIRVPHSPSAFRITGKDLRHVKFVIGTGGSLIHRPDASALLDCVRYEPSSPESLRPTAPTLLIDRHYALYACGLLAERRPQTARALAAHSLGVSGG